jgi:hypothetical protein
MQTQKPLGKEALMKEWDAFCASVLAETSTNCDEDKASEPDHPSENGIPNQALDDLFERVIPRAPGATRHTTVPISPALYNALRARISEATTELLLSLEYQQECRVPEFQSQSEALYRYFRTILIPHIVPARYI